MATAHSHMTFLDMGVVKRTLVYGASGSFSALVAFFLLPILTRYLTTYDYGVVETFTTLTTCLTGVVILGGNTILAKEYFDRGDAGRATLISRILTLMCLSSLLLAVMIAIINVPSNAIARLLKISDALVYLIVLSSLANAIIALMTTLLQTEKRADHYTAFVNSKTVIEVLISLVLIVLLGMKWQGRITGMVASSLLFAFVTLILFWKRGVRTAAFSVDPAKRLLALGLPLVGAHISVWVYGAVDRVMISNLFDLESTGLYSVGFRFGTVVAMVEAAFSMAWMPYFYENVRLRDPQTNEKMVKLTYFYAIVLLVFAVSFGFATQWLLPFMVGSRFIGAKRFTMLICIAYWFSGIWKLFTGYLIAESKTSLYACITAGAAVFHIGLNLYLLRRLGPIGAAWATMFTFGGATTATIIAARRIHPMPWACVLNPVKGLFK